MKCVVLHVCVCVCAHILLLLCFFFILCVLWVDYEVGGGLNLKKMTQRIRMGENCVCGMGVCMCDGWVYEFLHPTVVWATYDMRVQ